MDAFFLTAASLGLDSLVASIAIGALPHQTVKRSTLVIAFGVCDGFATLIGNSAPSLSHLWVRQSSWGLIASICLYAVYVLRFILAARKEQYSFNSRLIYALPILFSLDNLLAGDAAVIGNPLVAAVVAGSVSALFAAAGFLAGGALRRKSAVRPGYLAAGAMLAGAALQLGVG